MITLRQVLSSQSNILENARVKLVRHQDRRQQYRDVIKDKKKLLEYQREQRKDVFKGCDYIVSFIGREHSQAILFGVFRVKGRNPVDGHYDLESISEFDALIDRLIIDWGKSAITWHQWYNKQPKEVIEILPQGYIGNFEGLLSFVLDYNDLKTLFAYPEANRDWKYHLSAVNGVYLILDSHTGQQYIGSACGEQGIWQRWKDYALNGTGNNKELVVLLQTDKNYCRHFRFSVLQTLPSNITKREIDKIEKLYKEKMGSRVHGLNQN
ncbi:MAG: hypothetical protein C0508_20335 [Cyanobacteria bacterium PR.023]|nr:hypothetical protein [Cyanobacteria bacterium PR.023]